ncbi:deoxyribodipyrimidine photo-lyase [Tenuifilum thalassicum]|uniref:Deoxyribodipyrimidine photo-lyase n=1 Tax=Tenuifilum thalassicum TaxID=2590900 RepID=A0A7D4CH72_9BACT|nr:deoxyribodipyrimidine photo-lyase [Tenuifilum thalassicum]QKG80326.1 deoxyribodipyrimidine photo-lyase [Tenuifilum thalassicum]
MFGKSIFNKHRARLLKDGGKSRRGPVIYWMSRDQRVADNWALIYSIINANELKVPLVVVFTLSEVFPSTNLRHYGFMLKGLTEVEHKFKELGMPFVTLNGDPAERLLEFSEEVKASLLISDFDPLLVKRSWKAQLNQQLAIPHYEVDAHNVVPCWYVSPKQEFGAYTIRPKIKKHLSSFLTEFPIIELKNKERVSKSINWHDVNSWFKTASEVKPVKGVVPGEKAAHEVLDEFIQAKLNGYVEKRNDPTLEWQSNLSPYLHYGHISAQRVAIEVLKAPAPEVDKQAFLEELIVRRELSDNFCYYNPNYSRFAGFPDWAKETHRIHRFDVRDYLYTLEEFEIAHTHDPLWNAAQLQLVNTGKMHGYMRMYWAKKILEWTTCPEEAMRFAIYLNDKYSLDGRDPNGYTGIAWSIGGVHDRAWPERPIFGKIRYMNFEGCRRKFDVDKYIKMNIG